MSSCLVTAQNADMNVRVFMQNQNALDSVGVSIMEEERVV